MANHSDFFYNGPLPLIVYAQLAKKVSDKDNLGPQALTDSIWCDLLHICNGCCTIRIVQHGSYS